MISKAECLKQFKILAEKHGGNVTRRILRDEFTIPEFQWLKHFGTLGAFKEAAGYQLSKHQRQMMNDVAKHSSLDTYRKLNEERQSWGAKFLKPNKKRFKTVLVGSDVHDKDCDPFWRKLFIDTAVRAQPDVIAIPGDLFDLPEFGKYAVDPREWDVVGRIKWVHKFLGELRTAAPEAELIVVEGNHEYRLMRHLAEATPQLKAVLADLHGMTVSKLLGLDQFEVNYVAPADLATLNKTDAAAEIRRNWHVLYDCFLLHHFPEGNTFGMAGVNGHHHAHEVHSFFNVRGGAYEWHQLGSGHKREASYTNGEKWNTGFALVHIDSVKKFSQLEYLNTTGDHCVIGGKWYERGTNS